MMLALVVADPADAAPRGPVELLHALMMSAGQARPALLQNPLTWFGAMVVLRRGDAEVAPLQR